MKNRQAGFSVLQCYSSTEISSIIHGTASHPGKMPCIVTRQKSQAFMVTRINNLSFSEH